MACADARLVCFICNGTFATEGLLREHVEENYIVLELRFSHDPDSMEYFKRCRQCQACNVYRTFSSITDIMVHFQTAHPEKVNRASIRLTNYFFDALENP